MWTDDNAVSDTLGSILLVSITVASFVGLSVLVLSIPPPPDAIHAEIDIKVKPGPDATWSTGDESVQIRHLYGEPVPVKGTKFVVQINNDSFEYKDAALAFSDDLLNLGERWSATHLIGFNDQVQVKILVPRGAGGTVLAGTSVITGQTECSSDTKGPAVLFTQTPNNVEALLGATPVKIDAVLTDKCSAIDAGVDPLLDFWFNDGTKQSRTMTPLGQDRWTYTINPAIEPSIISWTNHALSDFKYQARGMADVLGNVADSDTITDFVDPLPPSYLYVEEAIPGLGSITEFGRMQNGSDSGLASQLKEATSGTNLTVHSTYGQVLSTVAPFPTNHQSWKNNDHILGDDGQKTKYQDAAHPANYPMRIEMGDPINPIGQVIQVKGKVHGLVDNDLLVDDGWRLQICWTGQPVTGSTCSVKSPTLPATNNMQWLEYDFTNYRPGGGQWLAEDLGKIDLVIEGVIVGGIRDGDWEADRVMLEVTMGPGYDMEHEFRWTNNSILPTTNTLEIRYWTSGGAFDVLIWDGTQFVKRGASLAAAAPTEWTISLSPAEWAGGNPRVKLESQTTSPASQATLHVDYMRVTSA